MFHSVTSKILQSANGCFAQTPTIPGKAPQMVSIFTMQKCPHNRKEAAGKYIQIERGRLFMAATKNHNRDQVSHVFDLSRFCKLLSALRNNRELSGGVVTVKSDYVYCI